MPVEPTSQDIRNTFGKNLRQLLVTQPSINHVCDALGIHRSQFQRFLSGTSFPRPDMLVRICNYFGVSTDIYTTPLLQQTTAHPLPSGHTLIPPSKDILPDGIYLEWSTWQYPTQCYMLHLVQFKRDGRTCRLRVFARPPEFYDDTTTNRITVRHPSLIKECSGFAFAQAAGFSTIDGLSGGHVIAFTTYLPGFYGDQNFLLGYKLTGTNYRRGKLHCHLPCVLQKIPQTTKDILKWARKPQIMSESDTPENILRAFALIRGNNS